MSTARASDQHAHEPRAEEVTPQHVASAPPRDAMPRAPEAEQGGATPLTAPTADLERRLASLDRALGRVTDGLGRLERREEALRAARSAGAVRPEEVARLIERDLESAPPGEGDVGASVQAALASLRRRQPGLFGGLGAGRSAGTPQGLAGGPGHQGRGEGFTPGAGESVEGLRRSARSGDRRSLLEYLRARRGGG